MDRLIFSPSITYLLLLVSLICSYYVIRKATTALCYRVIVLVVGIVTAALLTWAIVNDMIMDYQDANIGLGLIFFFTWGVTAAGFLLSIIMGIVNRR